MARSIDLLVDWQYDAFPQHYNVAGITNVTGVLFISCLLPNFFAQVYLEDIKMDRAVYMREFHDSYYRPSTFVFAKIFSEVGPAVAASLAYRCFSSLI